jgi:aryl-alcohol dehydrogenase-like predicted oxidoreductase
MQYRELGRSGFRVSVLSFGAWQLGDPRFWGPHDEGAAVTAVNEAIDDGINLFDTAEWYGDGESERVLGKVLGARRAEVLIASKVSPEHCAPARLREACEASLTRLGTDYIDLYQIHWPFHDVLFEDAFAELAALRDEGKIRAVGVSNYGVKDLDAWLGTGDAVSNQLGYNILFRAIEYDVAPACRRHGLGIMAYMPLMQGLLAGRWHTVEDIPVMRRRTRHFSREREGTRHGEAGCEALLMRTVTELRNFARAIGVPMATMCLCWLLAQPGVATAIIGARNPEQVRRNLQAGDLDIGPAAIAQLNEISYPLKSQLGRNADMWLSGADNRIR